MSVSNYTNQNLLINSAQVTANLGAPGDVTTISSTVTPGDHFTLGQYLTTTTPTGPTVTLGPKFVPPGGVYATFAQTTIPANDTVALTLNPLSTSGDFVNPSYISSNLLYNVDVANNAVGITNTTGKAGLYRVFYGVHISTITTPIPDLFVWLRKGNLSTASPPVFSTPVNIDKSCMYIKNPYQNDVTFVCNEMLLNLVPGDELQIAIGNANIGMAATAYSFAGITSGITPSGPQSSNPQAGYIFIRPVYYS